MARGTGTVTVNILGKADKLRQALDQADRDLAGFGGKLDDFGKKSMATGAKFTAGLTVPIIGGLGLATKAAADDAAAQDHLAQTLRNTTGATNEQVAAVEAQIGKMMKVSTFADDELRPAFETLVRETRDVQEATGLMNTAMDLAAAKNISVEAAAQILVKAHNGQTRALRDLGIETKNAEGEAASFGDVMRDVNQVVGGSAAAAADTAAGKTQMLTRDMGELVEQLGVALLPIMEKLIGWLEKAVGWFSNLSSGTQTTILIVGGLLAVIGPLTTAVGALSATMGFLAANPIVAVIAAVAALAAGLVYAYKTSESFRNIVNAVFGAVVSVAGTTLGAAKGIIEGIGHGFNWVVEAVRAAWRTLKTIFEAIKDAADRALGPVDELIGGATKLGGGVLKGIGGAIGKITPFAEGGIVTRPTMALIGEAGPEAVIPLSSGGFGGTVNNTVLVEGNVFGDRQFAQYILDQLLELQRRTGNLGIEAL